MTTLEWKVDLTSYNNRHFLIGRDGYGVFNWIDPDVSKVHVINCGTLAY